MEANAAWGEKFRIPFPLLSDVTRRIGVAYGAASTSGAPLAHRIAFVIGAEGRIIEAHRSVDPLTYPREQLQRLAPDS